MKSESVAEHIYSLHILADYFLPLEDPDQKLDWAKIHHMLQYHDIDEIETGDKIGYLKTTTEREAEAKAAQIAVSKFPGHMHTFLSDVLEEYEAQTTVEARFSKALDRIEPLFQLYNENGKRVLELQQTTAEQSISIKEPYTKHFPIVHRFFLVLQATMEKEGFFH